QIARVGRVIDEQGLGKLDRFLIQGGRPRRLFSTDGVAQIVKAVGQRRLILWLVRPFCGKLAMDADCLSQFFFTAVASRPTQEFVTVAKLELILGLVWRLKDQILQDLDGPLKGVSFLR